MSGILDHIGISVSDYEKSKAFYLKALAPLGIELLMEFGPIGGFGRGGKPELWIAAAKPSSEGKEQVQTINPIHVAVKAASREDVDAFYAAAIAAGGRDNGPPGIRAQYHPGYYGAFVIDPDGHNFEAVHHTY